MRQKTTPFSGCQCFDELGVVLFEEILDAGDAHHLHGNPLLVLQLEVFELRQDFANLHDVDVFFADPPVLSGLQRLDLG
jgi:hypothetical protein